MALPVSNRRPAFTSVLLEIYLIVARNMFLAEDYNSPQSVYWCLKTLIAVAIPEDDAFWAEEEASYPSIDPPAEVVPAPQQIVCNHPNGNHHFMLAPGQFKGQPMKAREAKYCKFAYSSAFAFSVPTGDVLHQLAPDSQLYLSRDRAETWKTKRRCDDVVLSTMVLDKGAGAEALAQIAGVRWYPWGDRAVSVDTMLVSPTDRWPDWHVRIHRIRCSQEIPSLHTVEGGFALYGRKSADGLMLPEVNMPDDAVPGLFESTVTADHSTLVCSSDGASGIVSEIISSGPTSRVSSQALKPDPNTNLVRQRTLIPIASVDIPESLPSGTEIILMSYVFGISALANDGWHGEGATLKERWLDRPSIDIEAVKQWFERH